jgi:parallel beta-helix repeat protein
MALKDQIFGQQNTGVQDGGNYKGKTSIEILNNNSTITIGDPSNPAFRNTFTKGQYGIYVFNAFAAIKQNTFANILNTAVSGDASSASRAVGVTDKNIFNTCQTGIFLVNGMNSTIQGNTFNSGTQFGIFWKNNYNRQLTIGGTSASQINTFNNNNWAGIMTSDNAGSSTAITISNNLFNGPWYADGIWVVESSFSSSVTYNLLSINGNVLNSIGNGITLSNIHGYYTSVVPNATATTPVSDVVSNTVNFNTTTCGCSIGHTRRGIKINNSTGIRAMNNNVASDDSYNWQNSGIHFTGCQYSTIVANTCRAGVGIQVTYRSLA